LLTLAKIYVGCKASVGQYRDVGRDVGNTYIVLSAIERYWEEERRRGRKLIIADQVHLRHLSENCLEILSKLQMVLEKNKKLGQQPKITRRMKWWAFASDVGPLRNALQENTSALAIFNNTLTATVAAEKADEQTKLLESQGRILEFFVTRYVEFQKATSERMALATSQIAGGVIGADADASWWSIDEQLQNAGFESEDIQSNIGFIREWVDTVVSNVDQDDEKRIPPFNSEPKLALTGNQETISRSRKQIRGSLTSLVDATQHAFVSEDRSLQRHFAQIYRALGENKKAIQQLKLAVQQRRQPMDEQERVTMGSNLGVEVLGELLESDLECESTEDDDSSAVDIFFDCVSRFSVDDSASSIAQVHANFSGSLDYDFESRSSFFPEQYMAEGLFSNRFFVVAKLQSEEDYRTQKYFVTYAETPRRWQRIILSITSTKSQDRSAVSRNSAPDNVEDFGILPWSLQSLLNTTLPRIRLSGSVTRIDLSLKEDDRGQLATDSTRIEAEEDRVETEMSDEGQILQDIEDLGCKQCLESDVIVKSRFAASSYVVRVESQTCMEQKAAFATAGRQGRNGFHDFFKDLKLLHCLRDSFGVAEFIGVVLDDTRRHLKSYLFESLMINSVERLLGIANSNSETIPWSIREIWAIQIIRAISDIHEKGFVVGVLTLNTVGIRADGTAVLTRLKTSQIYFETTAYTAPEIRSTSNGAPLKMMDGRTDIFQLGYLLWLLAEHKPKGYGYFCAKSACTNFPRYMCTADHANPVELPPCCAGTPSYFNTIIRECRLPDPRARATAHKLAKLLPYPDEVEQRPPDTHQLLEKYSPSVERYLFVYCNECGARTTDLHYHCYICRRADFDVCQMCFGQGVHCFDPSHPLVKRRIRNGNMVEEL
jgi:hypothetical protein